MHAQAQVSGGSQSFNAVNQLRVLGRWMRMLTIPNQSSVAKAFLEFDEAGRMKPSAFYDRVVDVMEELLCAVQMGTSTRWQLLWKRLQRRWRSNATLWSTTFSFTCRSPKPLTM